MMMQPAQLQEPTYSKLVTPEPVTMIHDCENLMPLSHTETKHRRMLMESVPDYQNTNMQSYLAHLR